jgi:hypothetical protein
MAINMMTHLLRVRTMEPEKELLLSNGCETHNNVVTVRSNVLCEVRAGAI